jgi:hypothetical protein
LEATSSCFQELEDVTSLCCQFQSDNSHDVHPSNLHQSLLYSAHAMCSVFALPAPIYEYPSLRPANQTNAHISHLHKPDIGTGFKSSQQSCGSTVRRHAGYVRLRRVLCHASSASIPPLGILGDLRAIGDKRALEQDNCVDSQVTCILMIADLSSGKAAHVEHLASILVVGECLGLLLLDPQLLGLLDATFTVTVARGWSVLSRSMSGSENASAGAQQSS